MAISKIFRQSDRFAPQLITSANEPRGWPRKNESVLGEAPRDREMGGPDFKAS